MDLREPLIVLLDFSFHPSSRVATLSPLFPLVSREVGCRRLRTSPERQAPGVRGEVKGEKRIKIQDITTYNKTTLSDIAQRPLYLVLHHLLGPPN